MWDQYIKVHYILKINILKYSTYRALILTEASSYESIRGRNDLPCENQLSCQAKVISTFYEGGDKKVLEDIAWVNTKAHSRRVPGMSSRWVGKWVD